MRAQRFPDFIKRFKPNFPVGTISRDFMANYAQITPMMRVFVPVMFFIDRKGVIQAQYFGEILSLIRRRPLAIT